MHSEMRENYWNKRKTKLFNKVMTFKHTSTIMKLIKIAIKKKA